MIKTPKFWQKKSVTTLILLPFCAIYWLIHNIKLALTTTKKINKKVICIGNLTAGGSGKTPTALAIGNILQELKHPFCYLSRGYGGTNNKIIKLSAQKQYDASITGDEPLLLKEVAPTYICKKRLQAAVEIDKNPDFKTIILDDGFQNKSLAKDLNILVVDENLGFGNQLLLPAGPLRENIAAGINRSDMIIVIKHKTSQNSKILSLLPQNKVFYAKTKLKNHKNIKNNNFLAFCGIAYPQKFFDLLKNNEIKLEKELEFGDHHKYLETDLEKISKIAAQNDLQIITTKKDWVKFPQKWQKNIYFADIELVFEDIDGITAKIKQIIDNA